MQARFRLTCVIALSFTAAAAPLRAIPVSLGNPSFETPANSSGNGAFGALNNTQVWTGDATSLHGFGFLDLPPDEGLQSVSLRQGAALTQEQNGGTVDGFTKASIPLPALPVGQQVSLTIAYALRNNSQIEWADASYFALYDSATFSLADPVGTALATTGFLPAPGSRSTWIDQTLNYTITGSEQGFLGIYLQGAHTGTITSSAGGAGHQAFFDNVRLDAPAFTVIPGDVDSDGDVDMDDFFAIRDNFLNNVNSRAEGDLNGDDIVDFDDFQQLVDNFPFPPSNLEALLFGGTNVPEPSTLALAGLAVLTVLGRRFRR